MPAEPIYLDYSASAPLRPEASAAMAAVWAEPGNAASVHWHGRRMHGHLERARETIAAALNAPASGLVFTAGGTEANNLALSLGAERPLLVSAIEHDSVLKTARTHEASEIPAAADGCVDLAALDRALDGAAGGALVSLMLVNNETGVIQPVAEAAALCRRHGAMLHCDAVQALGRIAIDMQALDVDMLSVSAHKIGGPQGVGALLLRGGIAPPAMLIGGGQERGRRAGTQNVPGIVGFAAALEAAAGNVNAAELAGWRDSMEHRVLDGCDAAQVIGAGSARVAGVSCLALPGLAAETQVMMLDLAGISVSAGSACSSGKVTASNVLHAMGLDRDIAGCAIRISGGWASCRADFERFAEAYLAMIGRARRAA